MLIIYTSPDSRWQDAMAWAKARMIQTRERRERCYKGICFDATMFYGNDEQMTRDYASINVPRLTDDML